MITLKKYKQFIAFILLALYIFVATPVQFWHQHCFAAKTYSTTTEKKDTASFTTSAGASAEGNCEICSHQYATYSNGDIGIFDVPFFVAAPKAGIYYSSSPSSPLLNFTNKGPPALV